MPFDTGRAGGLFLVPLQGTASWGARHPSLRAGVKHG
jgi:hypothetical protein